MEKQEKPQTKVCSKCGRELPTTNFYRHKSTWDNLQPFCKDCQRKEIAAYRERKKERSIDEEPDPFFRDLRKETLTRRRVVKEFFKTIPDSDLTEELRERGYIVKIYKNFEVQ